jgi:hypothetical protein
MILCVCAFSLDTCISLLLLLLSLSFFVLPFPPQPVSLYCSLYPSPPGTCFLHLLLIVSLSSCYFFPSFPATSCSPPATCIPLQLVFVSLSSSSCFPSPPLALVSLSYCYLYLTSPANCIPLLLLPVSYISC